MRTGRNFFFVTDMIWQKQKFIYRKQSFFKIDLDVHINCPEYFRTIAFLIKTPKYNFIHSPISNFIGEMQNKINLKEQNDCINTVAFCYIVYLFFCFPQEFF